MLRALMRTAPVFGATAPFTFMKDHDIPKHDPEKEIELHAGEVGLDRIKNLFRKQENGLYSKEIHTILLTTITAGITGFTIGGVLQTINLPQRFMDENQGTKFDSHMDARRQLQRYMFLQFGRGGLKLGWKIMLFCFLFGVSSVGINVYRGKTELVNFFASGALAGGLYKWNLGPKGMVSGAVVGAGMGSVYGIIMLLSLYISGSTSNDIYAAQSKWIEIRQEKIRENARIAMEKQQPELIQQYNATVKRSERLNENQTNSKP